MTAKRVIFKMKMATDGAERLLQRCDSSSLCSTTELQEAGEGEMMAPYLMDCRRKQKLMCQQLCMLDDMMALLTELSPEQLLNEPCPQNPGSEARARWKLLKTEYQEGVEEVERLVLSLLDRTEQLQSKRQKLEDLVVALEKKREECREKERIAAKRNRTAVKQMSIQLGDSLQAAQRALQICEGRISQLTVEAGEQLACIDNWSGLKNRLQECADVMQGLMQYRLLAVSPSQLRLELRPRAAQRSTTELQPLQLSVTVTHDDKFHLQVFQGTAGVLEESLSGPQHQLRAALLEVMQRYISQGEMLAEIQSLHSRFAIDWRPAERVLMFLKSASVVCRLLVDEGYPGQGRASLLSVIKDGTLLDSATLQPLVQSPGLTQWLEFLSSSPDV